jgi:hypothetical protein
MHMAEFHFILNPGPKERYVVASIVDGQIATTWCAEESPGWNANNAMAMVAAGEAVLETAKVHGFRVRRQGELLRDASKAKSYERWTNDGGRAQRFHSLSEAMVAADAVGGHVASAVSQSVPVLRTP